MFTAWKVASPLGIDLKIHWTFWLLPLWVIFTFEDSGFLPLWLHVFLIFPLFFCIVLHEYGHALMARHFGIGTRSITLSPLGGIAQLERMSRSPWEEFWIAIAGPAVNVVIAAILGTGLLVYALLDPGFQNVLWWRALGIIFLVNIVLVIFNLLPAFPMDGGRVFRALLAGSFGMLTGTRIAIGVGTVMAIIMGLAGVLLLGNPWLIFIALFVIWAGHQELLTLEMEEHERRSIFDDDAPLVLGTPRADQAGMQVTICRWDAQRGRWVRQTYTDRTD